MEACQNQLDPKFTHHPRIIETYDSWSGLLVESLSRFDHEILPNS